MRRGKKLTEVDRPCSAESAEKTLESVEVVEPEVLSNGRPVYKIDTEPAAALVIHCGDPRFQTAFRRFITEELDIKSYSPIVVGGGVHAFGAQSFLPKNFKVLWEQVKFFVKVLKFRRIVIINHADCIWYQRMQGYHPTIKSPIKGQIDLRTAARTLLTDFAGIEVTTYWAELDGDVITFKEVIDR